MYISAQTWPLNSHKMTALKFTTSFVHMAGRKTENISKQLSTLFWEQPLFQKGKGMVRSPHYGWDFFAMSLNICARNFRDFNKGVKLLQVQQG